MIWRPTLWVYNHINYDDPAYEEPPNDILTLNITKCSEVIGKKKKIVIECIHMKFYTTECSIESMVYNLKLNM